MLQVLLLLLMVTFTGNVSIAGTLTYQDVTNVDSVGIATAEVGLDFYLVVSMQ